MFIFGWTTHLSKCVSSSWLISCQSFSLGFWWSSWCSFRKADRISRACLRWSAQWPQCLILQKLNSTLSLMKPFPFSLSLHFLTNITLSFKKKKKETETKNCGWDEKGSVSTIMAFITCIHVGVLLLGMASDSYKSLITLLNWFISYVISCQHASMLLTEQLTGNSLQLNENAISCLSQNLYMWRQLF